MSYNQSDVSQYDVIILGAGPAGFTAGIYLARFRFKTLLMDTLVHNPKLYESGVSRSSTPGLYHNVPGFPNGIERSELRWLGIRQAVNSGCDYQINRAIAIETSDVGLIVHAETGEFRCTDILFATGVQDDWADLPGLEKIAGRCLFWSVAHNGKEAEGKPAAVIGHDELAMQEAIRLCLFTQPVYLFTHGEDLPPARENYLVHRLPDYGIQIVTQRISALGFSREDTLEKVIFKDRPEVAVQMLYAPSRFHHPRNELATNLRVKTDNKGYILINDRYETNVPHIYAVGDLTQKGRKLVLESFHQGMEAAWEMHEKKFRSFVPFTPIELDLP